jgi:hypothetical protein
MVRLADAGLRREMACMRRGVVCRKRRHATRGVAEAAMRSLLRRGLGRESEGTLNVYRCSRCFGWHVGHTSQSEGEW